MPRNVTLIDKIIGSRLKAARQSANLSQAELGKSVDASFQQVQKYEGGKNRISSAALVQFAEALDVPLMYFFEGLPGHDKALTRKTRQPEAFARFAKSRQAEQILRKFYALRTAEERRVILDMLEVLG